MLVYSGRAVGGTARHGVKTMTIKVPDEKNPELIFPVWLIGLPLPPNSGFADLAEGLSLLGSSADRDKVLPIFLDESAAAEFIAASGSEHCKGCVPRIIKDAKQMHLLLGFYAEKQGVTHVLIGKPNKVFGAASIAAVRLNVAMQLE